MEFLLEFPSAATTLGSGVRGLRVGRPSVERTAYSFVILIIGWLLIAAAIMDVEYYDGLSAISNARYFLGQSAFYVFDRGPLMAWVQVPAEAVKGWLGLHPLDVRPHHATMALIHAGYLLAVWAMLRRCCGPRWSTLLAFATAVTSFIFFSYAPFISHDLAPGALLLGMLIWSESFVTARLAGPGPEGRLAGLGWWLLLVGAGTLAPLVKQTYGVFWIAVLAGHGLPTLLRMDRSHRTSRPALGWLAAGAATSGLLVWVVYGLVLANWAPGLPLWLRPYRNLQYLAGVYDGTDVTFPLWIYVRNFWAYGRLTTLLIVPGVALSLRGSRLQRRVALAWIVAIAFVHAMPLREVRYLAFLAPLSAFLIVPAVRVLAERRVGVLAMAAVLMLDLGGEAIEASRIGKAFYRHNPLRTLLEPLSDESRLRSPIFFTVSMLSFVAPDQSPLAADRYHRVFHVGINHIGVLFGYAPTELRPVPLRGTAPPSVNAPDGSVLLFANAILAHGPTWDARPPVGSDTFVQGLATLQTVALRRQADGIYRPADPAGRPAEAARYLLPVAMVEGGAPRPLEQRAGGFVPTGGDTPATRPGSVTMRAFAIERMSGPLRPTIARH